MPSHLRRYDESGHAHFWTISCFRRLTFFHDDAMKRIVIDALQILRDRYAIALIGYVVMPEHVHVILYPHARNGGALIPIGKLLNAFKQHVGFHGKARLRAVFKAEGRLWSEPLNHWAHREFGEQPIWTPRGYDHNILQPNTLREKLDYCHKNPVARGLVERPEDWTWSSYRFYELGDDSLIAMDSITAWPCEW